MPAEAFYYFAPNFFPFCDEKNIIPFFKFVFNIFSCFHTVSFLDLDSIFFNNESWDALYKISTFIKFLDQFFVQEFVHRKD